MQTLDYFNKLDYLIERLLFFLNIATDFDIQYHPVLPCSHSGDEISHNAVFFTINVFIYLFNLNNHRLHDLYFILFYAMLC